MSAAQQRVVEAARLYRQCADWYRRCLEDIQDGRPVRGLGEARAGYDSALDGLEDALAGVGDEKETTG